MTTTDTELVPELGWSLWLADPNDPDIAHEAIAGGLVVEIEERDGAPVYVCGRVYRGSLVWTDVHPGTWAVIEPAWDESLAWAVYRGCCAEVSAAKAKAPWHHRLMKRALVAASVAHSRAVG